MINYSINQSKDISKINVTVKDKIKAAHSSEAVLKLLEVSRTLIDRSKNGDFDLSGNRKTLTNIAKSEFVMSERTAKKKLKFLGCKNTI